MVNVMKKILAIGEALIDFIASENLTKVSEVSSFQPKVGGAPSNVCGAVAKLSVPSGIITMLGNDAFGEKIIKYLKENNVSTEYLYQTDEANTALAFVSKKANGDSDYTFYRSPSADMLLEQSMIKKLWFRNTYALHFCSVDIGPFPMKYAHLKAIEYAKEHNSIISFDPNLRPMLWKSNSMLKNSILEFIPLSNILKISSDELEFITGYKDIKEALPSLFIGEVELVIYTKGNLGAEAYTKKVSASVSGVSYGKAIDTTGAGDGFIGSFLANLALKKYSLEDIKNIKERDLRDLLEYSNTFSAISVTKKGAIASYPTKEEMDKYYG